MKFTVSSIPVETLFDGHVFPKTLLLPANLENPTVDDCVRLESILNGFNLSTTEDFSRVINASGWEEFEYRGAVISTLPAKRVFTANKAPLDWSIGSRNSRCGEPLRLQRRRLPPSDARRHDLVSCLLEQQKSLPQGRRECFLCLLGDARIPWAIEFLDELEPKIGKASLVDCSIVVVPLMKYCMKK